MLSLVKLAGTDQRYYLKQAQRRIDRDRGRLTGTRRPPKRHRPGLMAVAARGPLAVVLARRPDDLVDFS